MTLQLLKPERALVTGGDPDAPADIPSGAFFEDNDNPDFLPAFEPTVIAGKLIETCPELKHLREMSVTVLWKRKGGASAGKYTLGTCRRASGLVRHFSKTDFIVTLSADHLYVFKFTNWQLEALIYHELLHTYVEDEKASTVGHDCEMFFDEVRRYGVWRMDLEGAAKVFKQVELPL
ncbi:MAG: hypothetical protein M3P51_09055 [Chloroflexota bacterium]|nr:hypothetical protein [Chloroflexota bacterium]